MIMLKGVAKITTGIDLLALPCRRPPLFVPFSPFFYFFPKGAEKQSHLPFLRFHLKGFHNVEESGWRVMRPAPTHSSNHSTVTHTFRHIALPMDLDHYFLTTLLAATVKVYIAKGIIPSAQKDTYNCLTTGLILLFESQFLREFLLSRLMR